jgi:hypothetical protein
MKIEQTEGTELIAAIAASVILYQFDMLFFLFIVPLNILALRRSQKIYLTALGSVLAAVTTQELIRFGSLGLSGQGNLLLAIGLFGPLSLLAGSALYFSIDEQVRRLYRFFAGVALPSIVGAVLVLVYEGGSASAIFTRDLIRQQLALLFQTGEQLGYGEYVSAISPDMFYDVVFAVVIRCILPGIAIQLGASVVLTDRILGRRSREYRFELSHFRFPEVMLWPFLVSWAVVLLSAFADLGLLGVIGWNLGLFFGLWYFIQGMSILASLLKSRNLRFSALSVAIWLLVIMLVPGVNLMVLLGMPLLGISEIWIRYRDVRKENSYENNS